MAKDWDLGFVPNPGGLPVAVLLFYMVMAV